MGHAGLSRQKVNHHAQGKGEMVRMGFLFATLYSSVEILNPKQFSTFKTIFQHYFPNSILSTRIFTAVWNFLFFVLSNMTMDPVESRV